MTIEKIISADDHVQETPDLWERRLPAHLREKAPKIIRLENGAAAWAWGANSPRPLGMDVWAGREIRDDHDIETVPWEKVYRGTYDPDERLNAMNRDGINASVLYPNFSRAFVGMWLTDAAPGGAEKLDSELALACIQAYNDHIADFCTTDPKRLIPVGIVPMESVETAIAEIKRMASKGVRSGLIPPEPGRGRFWNDPQFELLWQTMAGLNMVISLHLGVQAGIKLPASLPTAQGVAPGSAETMSTLARMLMAVPVTTLLWSGIFDRYPDLKLAAVETDTGWLAYVKQRAEWVYDNFPWRWHRKPNLKERPGYYFGRNLFATFQEDLAGIENRYLTGIDALCWSSDFPHPETTWPRTQAILAEQFRGLPDEDVRKLVAGNCARLFEIQL
jgi:predicted TIM-barrel fold metal-dependent hydrolase